jgi:hypothetical protein
VSRRFAQLQGKDGSTTKLSRKLAFQLVQDGTHYIVRRRPLVVAEKEFENYHEEQRHLSGRLVPRATRYGLNGTVVRGRGLRILVPRRNLDPATKKVERWLREERRKLASDDDEAVGQGDADCLRPKG